MPDGKYAEILDSFRTVEEIIRLIRSLGLTREPVIYGITKKMVYLSTASARKRIGKLSSC